MKKSNHIPVLDFVRGLAIIHIILYHYFLEFFHGSFLIVPEGVMANLGRLEIFKDGGVLAPGGAFGLGGVLNLIKNLFAFLFVYGFTSVNLFLLLSGFVLTYSLLNSTAAGGKNSWWNFLVKRWKRILIPFYISVILGIGFLYLRNVLFPAMAAAPAFNWLDGLKLIFAPLLFFDYALVQKFNGDYWFIPLILQLYLIFPILFLLLKKIGTAKFLIIVFILTVSFRFVAAYFLSSVPMGVIYPSQNSYYLFGFFLPRLFEFGLGMALAMMQFKNPFFMLKLKGGRAFIGGLVLTFGGFALDAYKIGWAFSDLVVALGLFLLFVNIGAALAKAAVMTKFLEFSSKVSYEVFLLHHYLLNYLIVPFLLLIGLKNETGFWLFMPVFFVGSFVLGKIGLKLGEYFTLAVSRCRAPVKS